MSSYDHSAIKWALFFVVFATIAACADDDESNKADTALASDASAVERDAESSNRAEPDAFLLVRDAGEEDATLLTDANVLDGSEDSALPGATDAALTPLDATLTPLDATPEAMLPDTGSETNPVCMGSGARFATGVLAHEFGSGQSFGQDTFPAPVLGPPRGTGEGAGSTDVVALGNGGFVALEFAGNAIVDGPGADFIVFENPFACGSGVFAELATVSVSEDGTHWLDFPCTATTGTSAFACTATSVFASDSCAGWHPVFANADTNAIDPIDPEVAGGDAFDLADLGLQRARYVRITDRSDISATVFDLDAVAIVHSECP